jgi:hypothetical protein
MANPSKADERLADAILSLVDPEGRLDMDLSGLGVEVKRHVQQAQKAESFETRAHGKDAKLDHPIAWMGHGERAQDALLIALRSDEVKCLLALQGTSIQIDEADGQPIRVRVTRTGPTQVT